VNKYISGLVLLSFSGVVYAAGNDSFSLESERNFARSFAVEGGICGGGHDFGVGESGAIFSCKQSIWVKSASALDKGATCGFSSTNSRDLSVRCNGMSVSHGCPAGYVLGQYRDSYGNRTLNLLRSCYKL